MSRRIFKTVVSLLSLLVLLPLGYSEAMTSNITVMGSRIVFSPNSASAAPLSSDFSHRYVVFLDGINTQSSPEGNGHFNDIQDILTDDLGITDDHFVYFSYSAAADRMGGVFCLGWGLPACSTTKVGDLTSLNFAPVYRVEDTKLSIDRQTRTLAWLIDQILKQDPSAEIDLVGFSLGGIVASRWASLFGNNSELRNHIHSIILINSPVSGIFLASAVLDNTPEGQFWAFIIRDLFFGRAVLTDLQAEPGAEGSIVASLKDAARFPNFTSIQSTTDFLVNGAPLDVEGYGSVSIGMGSQYWEIKHTKHHDENLGGQDVDTISLLKLKDLLSDNHNEALKQKQTALWVKETIQKTTESNTLNPPNLLTPTNGSVTSLRPVLHWADVPNVTGYRLDISQNANFANIEIGSELTQSSFVLGRDLEAGKTYYWRVFALLEDQISSPSTTWSFSVQPQPQPTTCNVNPNEPGIILYTEQNYSGNCLLLRSSNPNLGNLDNAVSSIRINGNYRVNLYEDINYGGRREEVNQSDPNLDIRSLGGQYSSIKIEAKGNCDDENANGVFLYSGKNYGGACLYLLTSVSDLGQTAVGNDEVSSVRLKGDYKVTLFKDRDFKGDSDEIGHDEPDLDQRSLGNQYSSARVEATNVKCDNTSRPGIYLYSEKKYKGNCAFITSDIPDLDMTVVTNDHLRSLKIVGFFSVQIFEDRNYGGRHDEFHTDQEDLTVRSLGNQFSSIKVFRRNSAPYTPILVSPPPDITFEAGQTPLLCWQSGSDPDGDALQFQARLRQVDQIIAASDWQTELCWQPPALAVGVYTWEVQARDGGNETSNWSPSYNFTINLTPTDTPTPTPTSTNTPTPTATPTLTATPTETIGTLPDLVVEFMGIELETGGACNFASTQLGVRVGIANIGQADAGPFVVGVNGVQQVVAAGLAAGQRTSVWLAGAGFGGETTALVDVASQVVESNEANNQLTQFVPIPTLPPTCTPEITVTPPTDTSTPIPTATATPTGTLQPEQMTLAFVGPVSVASGQPFIVTVQARGVTGTGLYGAQLNIKYDPSKVSVSNLQVNPDFSVVIRNLVDNTNGRIEFAASRQGPLPGLVGDVNLFTFEVTPVVGASGEVTFTFASAKAGNPQAIAYPVISQPYTVFIEDSPIPTFTPSPTAIPSLTPTPTTTSTNEPPTEPVITPTPTFTPSPTAIPTSTGEPTIEPVITPTPTLTPLPTGEPTITPTLTLEPTAATVSGQVTLLGRANSNWSGAVVTINDSGQNASTDIGGNFTIPAVGLGSHTAITADAPGYLPAVCTPLTVTAPETRLAIVSLLSGDLNDDNKVDAVDATTIGVNFGLAGSNMPADINRDEVVDILDLILVSINFERETQVWNCLGQ